MAQQGLYARFPAAEGDEELHGICAAPFLQDVLPEQHAGLGIEHPVLLEQGKSVGREHFGPLVAIVAGGVTAAEDVREAVGETVPLRRFHHRHFVAHLLQDLVDAPAPLRIVLEVDAEIEERELHLAQHLHGRLEVSRGEHALEERLRQRLAGLVVAGEEIQGLALPAPVLHELGRQFHRVPGNPGDPGNGGPVHLGEHVVQAVSELVEQCLHLVVGEQRRFVPHGRSEVAGHEGHWVLLPVARLHARDAVGHPGTAPLLRPGVEIEVELPQQLSGTGIAHLVEAHVGVPHVHLLVALADDHAEETADHLEHAGNDAGLREPGLELFLGDAVAMLAQLFAVVGDVPGLEGLDAVMLTGVVPQLLQLTFGLGPGPARQVTQEAGHLFGRAGHLGGQRTLGVVAVPQQLRQLVAQRENRLHHLAVVEAAGIRSLVRGARGIGLVEFAAQVPVVGIGHHRVVGGELQGEEPTCLAPLLGGLAGQVEGRGRQAGQQGLVGDPLLPGVGGVEQVLLEAGGELGEVAGDLAKARLLLRGQVHAGEAEVAQGVLQQLALGLRQSFRLLRHPGIGTEEPLVLPHLGAVVGELGQAGVVGFAQRFAVHHRVQVGDRRPGAGEPVLQLLQRLDEVVPVGLGDLVQQPLHLAAVPADEVIDGRLHVFRRNAREGGQPFQFKQGIAHLSFCGLALNRTRPLKISPCSSPSTSKRTWS